jgi:hypothetical protein
MATPNGGSLFLSTSLTVPNCYSIHLTVTRSTYHLPEGFMGQLLSKREAAPAADSASTSFSTSSYAATYAASRAAAAAAAKAAADIKRDDAVDADGMDFEVESEVEEVGADALFFSGESSRVRSYVLLAYHC